jgi:hypothetical protein
MWSFWDLKDAEKVFSQNFLIQCLMPGVNKVLLSDFCPYLGCLVDNFVFKFMKQNTIMKITQNNTILYHEMDHSRDATPREDVTYRNRNKLGDEFYTKLDEHTAVFIQ